MEKIFEAIGLPLVAIAIIFVAIAFMAALAAVLWGDLELSGSFGKSSLRLGKRSSSAQPVIAEPTALDHSINPAAPETVVLPHEAEPQSLPASDVAEVEKAEDESSKEEWTTFMAYFDAKTLTALDDAFSGFEPTVSDESVEFWKTDYIRRREALGVDRGREAMRDLATANPGWAMPHAVMLEWALADHDVQSARTHLAAGLAKVNSPQFGHVLSAGTSLLYRHDSRQAAFEFACEWSKADLPERIRAGSFQTLAEALKKDGDVEGYRIALEFAIAIQPTYETRIFSAAYSYADNGSHWLAAIWNYQKVIGPEGDGVIARNNLAIITVQLARAVGIEGYERASAEGDPYAAANLAHLLIDDGYLSLAEKVLNEVDSPGQAAENHASARTALYAAKRVRQEKSEEIEMLARSATEGYRASVASSLRSRQDGLTRVNGIFASDDRRALIQLTDATALVRLRLGSAEHEGSLRDQATCYAGWIGTKGSGILGSLVNEYTLIVETDNTVRLFQWPNSVSITQCLVSFVLHRVEILPELAAPPARPALGVGLLSLSHLAALGQPAKDSREE